MEVRASFGEIFLPIIIVAVIIAVIAVIIIICNKKTKASQSGGNPPPVQNVSLAQSSPAAEDTPKFCKYCGEPLDPDSHFCGGCGHKL